MIYWIIGILAVIAVAALIISRVTYKMAFLPPEKEADPTFVGEEYGTFREQVAELTGKVAKESFEQVWVLSHDGLRLGARLYRYNEGAPFVIMFHGYRSAGIRDGCGGFWMYKNAGFNILLVDQRGHGTSDGKTITFGVLERLDCLEWINFIGREYGEDTPIVLSGISMGAATVMMATDLDLPESVKAVVADCGYSSPKAIIKKVASEDMGLPAGPAYPFVKLGARLFGHFDLEGSSAVESMKKCKLPVLFIHGEDDGFVPPRMTLEDYEACAGPKDLFMVPGAGHGTAFLVDREGYTKKVEAFLKENL